MIVNFELILLKNNSNLLLLILYIIKNYFYISFS